MKQSQSEIATPFGLAKTFIAIPNANYFMLSIINYSFCIKKKDSIPIS